MSFDLIRRRHRGDPVRRRPGTAAARRHPRRAGRCPHPDAAGRAHHAGRGADRASRTTRRATLAFDGHFVFDGYAAFLKVLILLGAAGCPAAGRAVPARRADRALRVPAARAVLGARHVHDGVGQQPPRPVHGARAAEPADLRAGRRPPRQSALDRGRAEILRPRRPGLRHAALRLLAGLRLLGHDLLRRAWPSGGRAAAALPLGALVGLVFVVSGLAFKMAAVPFHMWTPDVYEGAPSPVTAFMAGAPKVAAVGPAAAAADGAVRRLDRAVAAGDRRPGPGVDGAGRVRGDRPDQHQAADGLQRDRQCRLRPGRCRGRQRQRASTPPWST